MFPVQKKKNAVLAEWKPPVYDNESGITLVTATTRRNSPNVRFLVSFLATTRRLLEKFMRTYTAWSPSRSLWDEMLVFISM